MATNSGIYYNNYRAGNNFVANLANDTKKEDYFGGGFFDKCCENNQMMAEENKWFASSFATKCQVIFSKICQKLFGCKSISQRNLEYGLKHANDQFDKDDSSFIKRLTIEEEKNIISIINLIESEDHFADYLNSPKGVNDKKRLEKLKVSLNEKSNYLHISPDCKNGVSVNFIVRERLFEQISINQKSPLHEQLPKDIERSPLNIENKSNIENKYDGEDSQKYKVRITQGNHRVKLTKDNLKSYYDELNKRDKMEVLASCQIFYINIISPSIRAYLNINTNSYFVAGPGGQPCYTFEFNQENNQITINATNLKYQIRQNKELLKALELDDFSFTLTLKEGFENQLFENLDYDVIQQYRINSINGLDDFDAALKELTNLSDAKKD